MNEKTERLLITILTGVLVCGFFLWVGVITYRDYMRTPHANLYTGKMEVNGEEIKVNQSTIQYNDPEDAFNP